MTKLELMTEKQALHWLRGQLKDIRIYSGRTKIVKKPLKMHEVKDVLPKEEV